MCISAKVGCLGNYAGYIILRFEMSGEIESCLKQNEFDQAMKWVNFRD